MNRLKQLLKESHYPDEETNFLVDGFTDGFDIGYDGPKERKSTSENIPFTVGNSRILWNKLMKEVKLQRVAGPFDEMPFDNYIQSPIGLVPKAGSESGSENEQTRLIFHLSYDFKRDGLNSVNVYTPKEKCSVKYRDLDFVIKAYLELCQEIMEEDGKNEGSVNNNFTRPVLERKWKKKFEKHKTKPTVYAGKSDPKSAFCILGLLRSSWRWLAMKAQDPESGKWYFFIDKCLPFGSSISCALFQCFSDALCYLIEFRLKIHRCITNYLDDFLFIARTLQLCDFMIDSFLQLCKELNVPVCMEKTEWANDKIIFLGILLDGEHHILAIPTEKKDMAMQLLEEMLSKKKSTVKDLQRLCGYLNFLGKAIVPGRTFTRRMYAKYSTIVKMNGSPRSANEYKLKQHHHMRLDQEFKLDCEMWLRFLNADLQIVVNRLMTDFQIEDAWEIGFYSDASASKTKGGFGAVLGSHWLKGEWGFEFMSSKQPSIEYLELFALYAGILTWQHNEMLNDKIVRIHCDNQAVVQMVNNLTSGCRNCMVLIRLLVLNNMIHNRKVVAQYIDTKSNCLADVLSCNQMRRFWQLSAGRMDDNPATIPVEIWPVDKIWMF